MWTDAARVVGDTGHGDWLRQRLTGSGGIVCGTVPTGYPAYARVLHPVDLGDGTVTTWSHVATVTGRRVHPLVQWHTLIGAEDPFNPASPEWPDGAPEDGNLALAPLEALRDVLVPYTRTPDDCFMAIWDGWGSHNGHSSQMTLHEDGTWERRDVPVLYTPEEWALPRLSLPDRDHVLLRGPLTAVTAVARYDPGMPWTQSPNVLWPADRAWCVASEIDFDSTLVAGSDDLVDAVLACPALEAWPVHPGDSLRHDADTVNAR